MLAFIDGKISKSRLIEALEKHKANDAIARGTYAAFAELEHHGPRTRPIEGDRDYRLIEAPRFRGCAVGCSLQDFGAELNSMVGAGWRWYDLRGEEHEITYYRATAARRWQAYEEAFGVPQGVAMLEDHEFESCDDEERRAEWPLRFARAVPIGADLSGVYREFVDWEGAQPAGIPAVERMDKLIELVQAAPVPKVGGPARA